MGKEVTCMMKTKFLVVHHSVQGSNIMYTKQCINQCYLKKNLKRK